MSDQQQKNVNLFHDPNVPSLAEALRKLEAMPDEGPSRKARARAAVATISRLLHKPAAEIPAQATYLKGRFMALKRFPTGLAPKSLANCKTEIRFLVRVVCGRGGRSHFRPLSPAWLLYRDAIASKPIHWKLSSFMAFCSAIGTAPHEVSDADIEKFRVALSESNEVDKPDRRVRLTIGTWNRVAATLPDWRLATLVMPAPRVNRWTIEPGQFAASFREDVDLWQEGLAEIDPEAEEGPIRALSPASLRLHRHQVFKAASALVFSGRPIDTITSLADLVEMDAFRTTLKYLRERGGGQRTTALHGLAIALRGIARHYAGLGDKHVERMGRICANYDLGEERFNTKSRDRLKNFLDDRLLGALLHLTDRLLDEAAHPRTSKTKARTLAQVAVAIEIELHAPVRLSNLVSLNLEQNIQIITVKGETRWILRFDRDETKNRSLLTYELPAAAVRRIERAFKFYEPTNGWLFPGPKGTHKLAVTLGNQVKHVVERRLGIPFNIHLLRGVVATLLVRENDNGMELAQAMLGNRSNRVMRDHYTSTAEQHLIQQAQETVQRVRIRTAPLVPRRLKPSSALGGSGYAKSL